MLDTLKLAIPINNIQHRRIAEFASEEEQWVKWNPKSREITFIRKFGLAETDSESFHRELRWDIPERFSESGTHLVIEFSVPKYWYGHNIRLLYDVIPALNHLKDRLEAGFKLKRHKLPSVETWKLKRADICYAWNLHSNQTLAQRLLDTLKHHHFPRKKPTIRPDSIFLGGATYSVKFYLKLPEFKAHDRKELLKRNAAHEWIDYLEKIAEGVLRYEVTLRHRYLKREGIETVGDLLTEYVQFSHDVPFEGETATIAWMIGVVAYHAGGNDLLKLLPSADMIEVGRMAAAFIFGQKELTTPALTFEVGGNEYHYPGGTFKVTQFTKALSIGQKILEKFVGGNLAMRKVDQVIDVLSARYKSVKAGRLTSFWLFVQKFGTERAKKVHGANSYYYNVRQLKEAGVSLVEPPSGNVVDLEDFRFILPSHYVTNAHDDFRDCENVLNIRRA